MGNLSLRLIWHGLDDNELKNNKVSAIYFEVKSEGALIKFQQNVKLLLSSMMVLSVKFISESIKTLKYLTAVLCGIIDPFISGCTI